MMLEKTSFNITSFLLLSLLIPGIAFGQVWNEPDVEDMPDVLSPYEQGAEYGWGIDLALDNYGFALGTQFRYILNNYSEITVSARLGTLRDVSEQSFQSLYNEVIPNKYQRVFSYPLFIGYKQRILSDYIYDNFRLFISAAAGPSFAYAYPYFDDVDGNGIRTPSPNLGPYEEYYDVFSGLGDGDQKIGPGGELMVAFDVGQSRDTYTEIRIGYTFHYFSEGIQLMEPFRYEVNERGQIPAAPDGTPARVEAADKQKFFGSPIFHITIGGLW